MYQQYYRQFLHTAASSANITGLEGATCPPLHMACHSHHYWPDVTLAAVQQYWHDAAQLVDSKWEHIFQHKIPALQRALAQHLKLPEPDNIALAPNTHELVYRLLSTFDPSQPLRILTTDSEFYSFERQLQRLEELPNINITRIATTPFDTLAERFEEALHHNHYQLAYASQVFFDSAVAFPQLQALAERKPQHTVFVIDGYHGFFARPTDLSTIADRVFYTAGCYKYLGAGEGLCFMSIPKNCQLRPLNTGWFAQIAELEQRSDQVAFSNNWLRFAGATMDYSTLYKALAVLQLFNDNEITVEKIHAYVLAAQQRFLTTMDKAKHPLLCRKNLIFHDLESGHGHFFTFQCPSEKAAQQLQQKLRTQSILCDRRQQRLRLGFAIYHPEHETYQRVFT